MAHKISSTSGKYEVWTANQPAWHGLGAFTEDQQDAQKAMELSGTGFEVYQRELRLPDGTVAEGLRANCRTDKDGKDMVLAYVTPSFKIFQNKDAWNLMEAVAGKGEAVFTSAGALNDGRSIFIACKLPGTHKVMKGHEIEKYLLLSNGHGGIGPAMAGGRALRVFFTPVNVVCHNTETAAIGSQDNGITLKHVGNDFEGRIATATKVISEAQTYFTGIAEAFAEVAKRKAQDKAVLDYFNGLYPDLPATKARPKGVDQKEVRDALWTAYQTAPGADTAIGTWWGAYNAITYFEDHLRWNRSRSKADRIVNEIAFGSGARMKQDAFEMALAASTASK